MLVFLLGNALAQSKKFLKIIKELLISADFALWYFCFSLLKVKREKTLDTIDGVVNSVHRRDFISNHDTLIIRKFGETLAF